MKRNKLKDDYTLITSAVLLLILSGFLIFLFPSNQFLPLSPAAKIIGEASLTIDFGNGEKRAFKGEIIENENLMNILNQAAKAGDLHYKLDARNSVIAIENFTANKIKAWQWHINGKKVEKPFYEIIVNPNDEILIKYAQK
ncbi:MAG: hypothetical protein UU81_C0016G0005 [Microgenomates group bacterium GW2011_GWC1_41_8]|uniref:DUF4430 domain-containing protein n=1 Tax=Candidatus Azambacteria bacterium GW2011_GWA2_39_10 TaxID=1618611 RepID=A0A0G0LXP6_9BACT|nr:MAG: hypothetical protein UT16_C0005G0010 [Candidatus Azambacteria bacterium GW2011_GWA2_39_10]KKS23894.1 MAG: hypothetical protein UU81_C0016G0005 [Microgenomates group bacterium GW2011_GWC1_41_8]